MKKSGFKKLHLTKEAIRTLRTAQLPQVAGGITYAQTLKCDGDSLTQVSCPDTETIKTGR